MLRFISMEKCVGKIIRVRSVCMWKVLKTRDTINEIDYYCLGDDWKIFSLRNTHNNKTNSNNNNNNHINVPRYMYQMLTTTTTMVQNSTIVRIHTHTNFNRTRKMINETDMWYIKLLRFFTVRKKKTATKTVKSSKKSRHANRQPTMYTCILLCYIIFHKLFPCFCW